MAGMRQGLLRSGRQRDWGRFSILRRDSALLIHRKVAWSSCLATGSFEKSTTRSILSSSSTLSTLSFPTVLQSRLAVVDCRLSARHLSTAASGAVVSDANDKKADPKSSSDDKKKKDNPNLFLDNLGTIFLVGIGSIVVYLIRSSYNTANRTAIRNAIENTSVLDPYEIDDLRVANDEFRPALFRKIVQALLLEEGGASSHGYRDFVATTRKVMCQHFHGDPSFTLQLGHLMDRVYVGSVLHYQEEETQKSNESQAVGEPNEAPLGTRASWALLQYLVILSLGVHSSVRDRVRLLFETILQCTPAREEKDTVSHEELVQLVGWLQRSCQLPPDTQIALTDTKIPTQTYRRALPGELVSTARLELYGKEEDNDSSSQVFGREDKYRYDLDEFHRMLRTTSICAWGECHVKKKSLE